MKILMTPLTILVILFTSVSCEKDSSRSEADSITEDPSPAPSLLKQFSVNLFDSGSEAINRSKLQAQKLENYISKLLNTPTQETLLLAQEQWLETALSYREFYFFRYIAIIEPKAFKKLNRLDYQIGSYPIQPGYLDKFGEYKYSGLVHNLDVPISKKSLIQQHGLTDLSDIVLGLYAIEFLLYDRGEVRQVLDFTANDSHSPEHKERGFKKVEEIPNNRRRKLLRVQTKTLVTDLKALEKNWSGKRTGTVRSAWNEFENSEWIELANKTLSTGLSGILLEVSEFDQKTEDHERVPPTIALNSFSIKQRFIHNALRSVAPFKEFLTAKKKSDLETHLNQALELVAIEQLTEKAAENTHWKTLFTQLKQASDLTIP